MSGTLLEAIDGLDASIRVLNSYVLQETYNTRWMTDAGKVIVEQEVKAAKLRIAHYAKARAMILEQLQEELVQ